MGMETLERYLQDIEERLIPEQEEEIISVWKTFAAGKSDAPIFSPRRSEVPPSVEWPEIHINDALESEELMVIHQFKMVSDRMQNGFGGIFTVRSNYGVGIMPSLYGAELFIMPRELHCLPNVKPIPGGGTAMREIVHGDTPDFSSGWGDKIFRVGRMYRDIFSRYPKINACIQTDHPDCQGPMDVCELLWGSDIFIALYDEETLVHDLLKHVTNTYKKFLDAWFDLLPPKHGLHSYFGNSHYGKICVRDDSAMNLSPEMYEKFIMPYNMEVLEHFDGGLIHSCGRVDHYVPFLSEMKKVYGFNMSQPEYNDMEIVYRHTVDKGIPLLGLKRETAEEAVKNGRDLKGLVSV